MVLHSISSGQYIHPHFQTRNTVADEWTVLGSSNILQPVVVSAVFWFEPSENEYVIIKDNENLIFFSHYYATGSFNYLSQSITLCPPFSYYESEGSNILALYGNFV